MGQKVHPHGMRLGIIKNWNSIWYANSKEFSMNLQNDYKVRKFLLERLHKAFVSKIIIERPAKSIRIIIYTARPGIVIGKKGEDIEKLRQEIIKISGVPTQINISEIAKPEIEAILVSTNIASQLERRIMFRRVMKRAVQNTIRAGAKGVKIAISGRLGGAEIARSEWYKEGRIPLHTLRANIDYGTAIAKTTYGVIGIKVWIFKGEILDRSNIFQNSEITISSKKNKKI